MTAFEETPAEFLWALRKPFHKYLPPSIPKNVRIEPWVEQKTVLTHSSVNLMISHCGMNSINEALYNEVPLIGIPHTAEQVYIEKCHLIIVANQRSCVRKKTPWNWHISSATVNLKHQRSNSKDSAR